MANGFEVKTVIDRPIDEVFAFLADGTNDKKFSSRVQDIKKTTDGPVGTGTVFASTVKDAGMTTQREFELTEFQPPSRIRWTERSKNSITVPTGGYDLSPAGEGKTEVRLFNEFQGSGVGKLLLPLAARAARKGADDFGRAIKDAVEAS